MAKIEMFRAYVEKVLVEYLGVEKLVVNADGSIPVQVGSAAYYVRLLDGDPAMLQVYSPLLHEVPKTAELLEKLNEINASISFARAFWVDEEVIVATELVAETLDHDEISNACFAVGTIADHWDAELQKEFGGKLMAPGTGPATDPQKDDPIPGYV